MEAWRLYLGMGWDSPDSGKWPARPQEPEIEHFIKRMCHISVRIWRDSRLEKNGRPASGPRTSKDKLEFTYVCSGLKGNAIQKLRLGIYCSPSPQPAHKSWPGMTESRAGDTRSSPLGVNTHQKKSPKMESSKKTSEYFCQFQYRRSGINVKNARVRFLRGMRILYIRSRIKTTMEWEYPPAPPDTLRINLKCECNTIYFLWLLFKGWT